jgi:hypothetical protein
LCIPSCLSALALKDENLTAGVIANAFDTETPDPKMKFTLVLTFQDIDSNKFIKKKLFFNAAKFVSTQTH